MSRRDEDHRYARAQLTAPDPGGLSRRRFLQLGLAGTTGLALLDGPLGRGLSAIAEAATPLSPGQGILVLIECGGGLDGFNMVVPASNSAYYAARGSIAVPAGSVLPLAEGFGFHPALAKLHARYQQGKVACVMGVGYPNPDLSHFNSMAYWMSGQPGLQGVPTSGWVGRWLDAAGNPGGVAGVAIDDLVPLHMIGESTAATALPTDLGAAFGAPTPYQPDSAMFRTLAGLASQPTGLGPLADLVAANSQQSMALAAQVSPLYSPALPKTSDLATRLVLAARLINAGLGTRVISVDWQGDFDVHAGETSRLQAMMADLDAGIDAFYAALAPQWSGAVTLMTFSEFGRRVKANESGTDHGTASSLLVIGDHVKGGLVGQPPSLTALDPNGNAVMTTDFRSVYSTVISDWIQGDPEQVLGGTFAPLPLFSGAPTIGTGGSGSGGSGGTGGGPRGPVAMANGPGYYLVTASGGIAAFGRSTQQSSSPGARAVAAASVPGSATAVWLARADGTVDVLGGAPHFGDASNLRLAAPLVGMAATPTGKGYWLLGGDGGIFSYGDAGFHGSTGNLRLVKPVVGMATTPTGKGYWLVAADGGIFSYGDAGFHGSTGNLRLVKPVVGMAATPTGKGYWLVAADGGIFAFGDAGFHGSTGNLRLVKPVVGMAASATGKGYLLVAADGGIFAFGDAPFRGGLAGPGSTATVVGIAA